MAIQYPGGSIVNTTVAADTKTLLVDNVKAQLVNAGWTVASGASGDWKLDSATDAQGKQLRIRIWDGTAAPTSTNCAQIRIMNVAETVAPAQSAFLLPGAGKTYRVIASRYQCFLFVPGSVNSREFACFGQPYTGMPSTSGITAAGWMECNGNSDSSATVTVSLRTELYTTNPSNIAVFRNSVGWGTAANTGGPGWLGLVGMGDPSSRADTFYRWDNDDYFIYDALIGWGLAGLADEAKVRGQLWGAFVDTADRVADTTFSFDDGSGSHTFMVITNSNTGPTRGTLCVAVD